MAATVRVGPFKATINGYHWKSESVGLARLLNAQLALNHPDGPGGEDPNPDLTAAREAVKAYGGEVLEFDRVKRVAGRVY